MNLFCNHIEIQLHPSFHHLHDFLLSLPKMFENKEGTLIHNGRNQLRCIQYKGTDYIVKEHPQPNIINQWVYGNLRPAKTTRAYRNALKLQEIGVGTPQPIGYLNLFNGCLFGKSYFVTLRSSCTHRYDDLFKKRLDYEEKVFESIGKLTAKMHENNMLHKDYSLGNILFERKNNDNIYLELIDLNRMFFGSIDIRRGCKNFERLPGNEHTFRIMAKAYAEARHFNTEKCYDLIMHFHKLKWK